MTLWMMGLLASLASCNQNELLQEPDSGAEVTVISAVVDNGMKTRVSSTADDEITRCYVQVFSGDNATTPVTDSPIEGVKGAEGAYVFTLSDLQKDVEYTFLFWADNGAYEVTDLKAVTVSATAKSNKKIGVAYSCMKKADKATMAKETVKLTHAVSKLTLKTTGALPSGKNTSMTYPTFEEFNVLTGTTGGTETDYEIVAQEEVLIPSSETSAPVFSVYALGAKGAADKKVTIVYDGHTSSAEEVSNLPVSPNKHIILQGDVSKIGAAQFTASISNDWEEQPETTLPIGYTLSADNATMEIYHANGLMALAEMINGGESTLTKVLLTRDIDLSKVDWEPIGTETTPFVGTFDGQGHTIRGLNYNKTFETSAEITNRYVGIFGRAGNTDGSASILKNVTIDGVRIEVNAETGNVYTASLVGNAANCYIDNCHTTSATITGKGTTPTLYLGGLAGYIDEKLNVDGMTRCSATDINVTLTISGTTTTGYAGGLVGQLNYGVIAACHVSGKILCKAFNSCTGGIVGQLNNSVTMTACYNTAEVTSTVGAGWCGALCTVATGNGTVTYCASTTDVWLVKGHLQATIADNIQNAASADIYATVANSENTKWLRLYGVEEDVYPRTFWIDNPGDFPKLNVNKDGTPRN